MSYEASFRNFDFFSILVRFFSHNHNMILVKKRNRIEKKSKLRQLASYDILQCVGWLLLGNLIWVAIVKEIMVRISFQRVFLHPEKKIIT